MSERHGIAVESLRPRRKQRLSGRYDGTVVEEATGSRTVPVDKYRTDVYYSTLDTIMEEMNRRFSELNLSLLSAMQALLPTSKNFLDVDVLLPFLHHYDIDEGEMRVEVMTAKTFLQRCKNPPSFLHQAFGS